MRFWTAPFVPSLLTLVGLIAIAAVLRRLVPGLQRLGVPNAILAGVLGLALGPSGADVLPVDIGVLEVIVYHAFAIVFISVGLRARPRTRAGGSARSMAFGIATVGVGQAFLGFVLVGAWMLIRDPQLHPGLSWMVTLGFMQGPGQALALGSAWEGAGLADGGQIGLIFAALGFAHCIILGVPLVVFARRRGWVTPQELEVPETQPEQANDRPRTATPGQAALHEPLSTQLLLIGTIYIAVFGVIDGLANLLPDGHPLAATLWGFHFIVGSGLALGLRAVARRTGTDAPFNDDMLARISVVAVDVTTAGAIAAVRLDVLTQWLGPILFMTTIAGLLTLFACVWAARRIFPERPLSHALVLLGASTGTIATGLALLRMLDPELKGPVARNVVIAATASIPLNAPLFLLVIPFAVSLWPGQMLTAMVVPAVVLAAYLGALLFAFHRATPAQLYPPLSSFWPEPRPPSA